MGSSTGVWSALALLKAHLLGMRTNVGGLLDVEAP